MVPPYLRHCQNSSLLAVDSVLVFYATNWLCTSAKHRTSINVYLNGCCQELKIDILGTHPSAILMFFFLETSVKNILHLPFTKIIKATGNGKYCTFKAREESKLTVKKIATIALYRLFELILLALNVTFYVFF